VSYAVELVVNEKEAAPIRKAWDAIASLLPRIGSTPHVSLAVFDDVDTDLLTKVVASFAEETPALSLCFSSLSIFPGQKNVLFLAPVMKPDLLRLHEQFHTRLAEHGLLSVPQYSPGAWVPHCTLTVDESLSECLASLAEIHSRELLGNYTFDHIQLVRYKPFNSLALFGLNGC
jgi:2'-5' RNA ligase